jgi:glutathione S-transferase
MVTALEIGTLTGNYELIIGNKNLSSWSLRPWLALKYFGIPFFETHIELRKPDRHLDILQRSPSGKVPALKSGDLLIWDSLAIIEYLADNHPDKQIWPQASDARAIARCVSAEMHSGFYPLRNEYPMYFVESRPSAAPSEKAGADMQRIVDIWRDCLARFGGDGGFLFGGFSAADAMFAPVVSRFVTYAIDLAQFGDDGTAAAYRDRMMALPEMQFWAEGARAEG